MRLSYLPVDPEPETALPQHGRLRMHADKQSHLSILVIDDDDAVRESVAPLLRRLGHTVFAAADGEEGLRKLESGLEPDLVLLDLNMPGLGGVDTFRRVRALRPLQHVAIMTGLDRDADDLLRGSANVRLLQKPFNLGELRELLSVVADERLRGPAGTG